MANERNIGRIVTVDSLSVYVRLDDDLKSLYKSGYEEILEELRIDEMNRSKDKDNKYNFR